MINGVAFFVKFTQTYYSKPLSLPQTPITNPTKSNLCHLKQTTRNILLLYHEVNTKNPLHQTIRLTEWYMEALLILINKLITLGQHEDDTTCHTL